MPNPHLSAVLVVICFLAIPFDNVFFPLAQAVTITPAMDSPDIYDTTNPADPILEESHDALTGLPLDKKGAVDWMNALNSGVIVPRAGLKVTEKMEILDADIIMKNTKGMPYVKFPHSSHTRWLACVNCHDEIFTSKAGDNPVNMTKIFLGQYCGVCHGKVAFVATSSCERCHSIPRGGTDSWWYPW